MLKTLSIAATALLLSTTAIVAATPAAAQRADSQRYDNGYRGDQYRHTDRRDRRDYRQNRRYYSDNRRNRDRKCRDGDGGTIVGAIAGGLLGREVAGRGDRTLGTVLGGVGGAVAGRAIDRSDRPGYCR